MSLPVPAPAVSHQAQVAGAVAATFGPGWDLDLVALAEVEHKLAELAEAMLDPADERSQAQRAAVSATSTIATVLWFDALRADDRVNVTPAAAPLVRAVHLLLDSARASAWPADGTGAGTEPGADAGADAVEAGGGAPAQSAGVGMPGATGGRTRTRPLRATGVGTAGPGGTVWAALARRYAADRFDRAPAGRQICILDYTELRDATVWEAVTDERAAHLGELLWVVTVTGTTPTGTIGGPARAARMFEAAGWQVLTLRYGRRLAELFRRPGGPALERRLAGLSPAETRSLLHARGVELRRRLAGTGAAGVGISRLLDTLTDDEVLAAVRDLGGHDIALLVDAFDEVDPTRPTVLFAYTDSERRPLPARLEVARGLGGRPTLVPGTGTEGASATTVTSAPTGLTATSAGGSPAGRPGTPLPGTPIPGIAGTPGSMEETDSGQDADTVTRIGASAVRPLPLPATSRGAVLCSRVAAALDQFPAGPAEPSAIPTDAGRSYSGWMSTQATFGSVLHDLTVSAPDAAATIVTLSTFEADHVVSAWIAGQQPGGSPPGLPTATWAAGDDRTACGPPATRAAGAATTGGDGQYGSVSPESAPVAPAVLGTPLAVGGGGFGDLVRTDTGDQGGQHVAGGLSAGAFAGVLGSLSVAWSRSGLPLLPLGVADEAAVAKVLPAWSSGAAEDARSVLAIADTPGSPSPGAAWAGRSAVPGAVCWEPAFAQDLAWISLAAFGALARADGISSIIRLSARPIEQHLAAVPADERGRSRRRAHVLAGAYRLRDSGASRPALTLVGVGAVMPEVLRAADELTAGLGRGVAVVCVTSAELLFHAFQARRGLAPGSEAILGEVFPLDRRSPLVTVVEGDPQRLAFLAGVHGDPISTLGSSSATGQRVHAAGWAAPPAPVDLHTIIGAALDLLDEASETSVAGHDA